MSQSDQKFFNIKHIAWLPNQSGLLISAARTPNRHFRIWQVSAALGGARPLTKDSETYSVLSLDKAAAALVSTQIKEDFSVRLFVMAEPSAGRVIVEAMDQAIAPDGRIFFTSSMSGNTEIWSIGADGGEQRQLTNDTGDDFRPLVSPDNNSIFFTSNRTGEAHVWRMSTDGSNQVQLTRNKGGFPIFVSPDAAWVYYHHPVDWTLWRVSLLNGEEQVVWEKSRYLFAISPDGSRIAFTEPRETKEIIIVSVADRQTLQTFRYAQTNTMMRQLEWMPDGKSLAYILANTEREQNALWLHPLDAGTPQKIVDLGDDEINSLAIAPDGKSFAIAQGSWKNDAVLLKGLN